MDVFVVLIETDADLCSRRCDDRKDHPTIKAKGDGRKIIKQLVAKWEKPMESEGIRKIYEIYNNEPASNEKTQATFL